MKKTILARLIISLLVLLQVVALGLYLRHDDNRLRSLVSVDEQSYYILPVGGRDTLFFALASDTDLVSGVRDSVVLLRALHTRSAQARHTVTHSGFRVSRSGEVEVYFTPRPDTLRGKAFQALIKKSLEAELDRERLLKKRVEELRYYARTHSVTDQGYNEVMSYGDNELQRWENSKKSGGLAGTRRPIGAPDGTQTVAIHGGRESLRTGVETKGAGSSQTVPA